MEIGIVGLPNVGKSTLFNALTDAGAASSNYPFTTIDPNVGVVSVPDRRLDILFDIFKPPKKTYSYIKFVDIAGLVKGASKGEGLGNKFLANIREVDAIIQVVRCFRDSDVVHVLGDVDPIRDIEVIEIELILSDLESVNKMIDKNLGAARSGDKEAKQKLEKLEILKKTLSDGKMAILSGLKIDEMKEFNLLTSKPMLYVANTNENPDEEILKKLYDYASKKNIEVIKISAKIESEIVKLPENERKEFLKDIGEEYSGLEKIIIAGTKLLDLITFFTVGSTDEVRAWSIKRGTKAPQAAGKIHSDFERGFIRAEVYSFDDIVKYRDEKILREKGLIRLEGKDYEIKDGDICFFRFNV
jgi:GTP-binding protein YchF